MLSSIIVGTKRSERFIISVPVATGNPIFFSGYNNFSRPFVSENGVVVIVRIEVRKTIIAILEIKYRALVNPSCVACKKPILKSGTPGVKNNAKKNVRIKIHFNALKIIIISIGNEADFAIIIRNSVTMKKVILWFAINSSVIRSIVVIIFIRLSRLCR